MDIYVIMSEFVSLAHVIYSRMSFKIAESASGKEMSHQNGVLFIEASEQYLQPRVFRSPAAGGY